MSKDKHIPQGYKESPLGIIPKEWEVKRLGEVCSKITDGTHDTPQKQDVGVPYLTAIHVKDGVIDYDNCYFLTQEDHNEIYQRCNPEFGDVLMVNIGAGVGAVAMNKVEYEFSLKNVALLKPNKEILTGYFLESYLLASKRKNIHRLLNGGAQPFFGLDDIARIHILLPSLIEQNRLESIISLWDTAIKKQSELIEKLKLRKRALMQQLLTGKKRLPGFSGEWKVQKIKDHFMQIEDRNDGKGHIPMTISAKYGLVSQKDKFDRVVAGNSLEKYTLLRKGDFAYNKGNSNLYEMGCIYRLKEESAVVPFVYICFRTKDNTCSEFYKHFFINHGLDSQLKRIITSGARGDGLLNVNSEDFMSLKIPYPIIEEQEAIANILNSADKEIELAIVKLESLQAQKRGLMQQLLTGKKRIKNIE